MSPFHVIVHAALPSLLESHRITQTSFGDVSTLELNPTELTNPWPIDFMTAFDRLESLPRMFIELDGAWVWVGELQGQRWQLDGLLNDSPCGLMTVEMKGTVSLDGWTQFRDLLIASDTPLAFQLIREGLYVTEREFTRIFIA